MDTVDLATIEVGKAYRVVTNDDEELVARVVAIDMQDKLFVYDIVESNKPHTCLVGHILQLAEIAHVQCIEND